MRNFNNSFRFIALLLLSILFVLFQLNAFSQGKEANIWYFGQKAGIDFNGGSPPTTLLNGQMETVAGGGSGSASIANSNGDLLFYSDGVTIWNRNHQYMQNGSDMGHNSSQGAMIVPKSGSDHLYYFFNFFWDVNAWQMHFQYSLINMDLDNGNGGVIASQKGVRLFNNSSFHLSAVHHANGQDVWVLAHKYYSNYYYAYLITADSLHHTPIISQAGLVVDASSGYMKISPNGKKVALAIDLASSFFELLDFDNETGVVTDVNMVYKDDDYYGVEFSPDNSKLYLKSVGDLFQYDLNAGSPQEILESEVMLNSGSYLGALQLAPDGKIYCSMGGPYLSVIHQPNNAGSACDFKEDAIDLEGRLTTGGLPSFIQSYLNDPTFTTQFNCVGDATTFEIAETNGIDSVFWKFNDFPNMPNDTSTLFSPQYTFSHAGKYQVDLTVYSGLLEKTVTQEVIVHPLPEPDIGNDTLFCDTSFSITLNANCNAASYFWSTWEPTPEITVGDTGTYWVRATSAEGCTNYDTINIGLYPLPQLDESNLVIINTGCGQNNGSITGLQIIGTPPFAYYWVNVMGDTVGFNIDLLNLSAGAYSLIVAYGTCSSTLATYLIEDDGNIQIDSVAFTNDHCSFVTATLTIYASATNPDILTYSIDGVNFLSNGGIFTNLAQGSYTIIIEDTNNCVGNYLNNPVIIQNIGGPEITTENVTPENDFSSDGSIFLEATVASGDVYYSIYNGSSPQTNNGLFENLSAGTYNCKVWDESGCDTTFEIIVPRNTTTILEAISGFGNSCVDDTAVSSLNLEQFNGVFSFEAKIYYDINIVTCVGYINLLPELQAGFNANISTPGEVQLNWQGTLPLTLPDTVMTKLVFGGLGEGVSLIYWEAGPGESVFFDQNMDTINAVCHVGEVHIYSSPQIDMQPNEVACAGDTISVLPTVNHGNGTLVYSWSGPNGYQSQNKELFLSPISTNQSGTYTLTVVDSMHCKENQNININIIPSPVIAFSEYDTLWVEPGFILEAGYGAEFYYWNTGETTETIVIDSMGNYSVELTSFEGCKSTDTIQILWSGTPFYLPNAFTPNGDGLNDSFKAIPRYDYVNKYHLSIYNRWGQRVYETMDINKGWDGTYKGSPCTLGAYVYHIVYEEFGQQPVESKVVEGTVVLVR
jgi:gliding motility-associated-like protein